MPGRDMKKEEKPAALNICLPGRDKDQEKKRGRKRHRNSHSDDSVTR
jgi:hypothetical protein